LAAGALAGGYFSGAGESGLVPSFRKAAFTRTLQAIPILGGVFDIHFGG